MADPFARLPSPIPVSLVTGPVDGPLSDGTALLRLAPPPHAHAASAECPACAAASDVRARLFDLLEAARQKRRPAFTRVIVDASALSDAGEVLVSLRPGGRPARGLRDHAVARNFRLLE